MTTGLEKIQDQREKIDRLKGRHSKLTGEVEQLEKQHDEELAKLKKLGVDSVEEARTKIKELETRVGDDEKKTDDLIRRAEAVLDGD